MARAIDEVIESMQKSASSKAPSKILFADKRYSATEFSQENFRKIKGIAQSKKIAALDAGNAEVMGAPNFSLQIFRFAGVTFAGNKRVDADTCEAYCLAQARHENGKILYEAEIFPRGTNFAAGKKFSFDSEDASLGPGIFRAQISAACSAARRCLEWEFAARAIGRLAEKDVALIDGSLQTVLTGETEYANSAFDAAKKTGALLCGLAKTSRLFTDAGTPAASAVFSLAKKAGISRAWDYHPVAEINSESHRASMHFVRLHEASTHAFRFEIFNEQKEHAEEVIASIAKNSCDRTFAGYPYALIAAHMAAKIRPEEIASERALFLSRAGDLAREFRDNEKAGDAHGVLDRM